MISVCIASHNGEKYLSHQIDSILSQLGNEDELIISDDGSTDTTLSIINSIHDRRIKLLNFKQPILANHPHEYVCRNFENAICQAKGDYIFLSDQDDEWMPNKVDQCVKDLQFNILVVHRAEICDDELKDCHKLMYSDDFVFHNYLSLKRGKYYGCTIAFRKELLSAILPFPHKLLLHDQWIGCLAELVSSVYYEKRPLIKYRQHNDSTSNISHNSLLEKFFYRLYMFCYLIIRKIKVGHISINNSVNNVGCHI